ncbi:hypothetical protein B9Z19DRAFT_165690 [Tuber borchii]|uniref:Uncharacterized protein n=1 Tax=Tuber borchii TaxID=42251 RepID=A0A2T6ZQ05_TUBBO|nr:hypothetical protein B9Z19DRAFT_165690 [Tuber borchii]
MVFLCFFFYPHRLTYQPTLVGQTAAVTALDHKVFPWGVLGTGGGRSGFWLGKFESFFILNVQIFPFSFFVWDVFRFFILLYTPIYSVFGGVFLNPFFFLVMLIPYPCGCTI